MINISARLFKNPFMRIGVTESTREWGGQTDHSTGKGNNHEHFSIFYLFCASFKLDLAVLTVFPEFVAFFLYSRAHNSCQN